MKVTLKGCLKVTRFNAPSQSLDGIRAGPCSGAGSSVVSEGDVFFELERNCHGSAIDE